MLYTLFFFFCYINVSEMLECFFCALLTQRGRNDATVALKFCTNEMLFFFASSKHLQNIGDATAANFFFAIKYKRNIYFQKIICKIREEKQTRDMGFRESIPDDAQHLEVIICPRPSMTQNFEVYIKPTRGFGNLLGFLHGMLPRARAWNRSREDRRRSCSWCGFCRSPCAMCATSLHN